MSQEVERREKAIHEGQQHGVLQSTKEMFAEVAHAAGSWIPSKDQMMAVIPTRQTFSKVLPDYNTISKVTQKIHVPAWVKDMPGLADPLYEWKVCEKDFPAEALSSMEAEVRRELFRYCFRYAILAPSTYNNQPWKFRYIEDFDFAELYLDRTKSLHVLDPDNREAVISCGAALFNFCVAARYHGFQCGAMYTRKTLSGEENRDLLARLEILNPDSYAPTAHDIKLFYAIKNRCTDRHEFEDRPVPNDFIDFIETMAIEEGVWIKVCTGDVKDRLIKLIGKADIELAKDKRYRSELASWMHANHSPARQGMFGYQYGYGELTSMLEAMFSSNFDWGAHQAKLDKNLSKHTPLLIVMGTMDNGVDSWLRAGQCLEHIILTATANGLSHGYLNSAIEVDEFRQKVRDILGMYTAEPQIILRLGYCAAENKHTPRRHIDDVFEAVKMT